ncbi:MAG: glycosyltransferase family 4 protein [Lentisphaeria bacterium]|nr:glycosyltransferase family 4 protein [Lentisphaeria bacterium]
MAIKVLYLNHVSTCGGGAEQSLIELLDALPDVDATVMMPSGGDLVRECQQRDIPVVSAPLRALSRSKDPLRQIRFLLSLVHVRGKLRRLVRKGGFDVVHANSTSAAVYAAWAFGKRGGDGPGPRVIWHCRDSVPLGWIGPWLAERVSVAVAISDRVGDQLKPFFPADRVTVIKNGVAAPRLAAGKSRRAFREDARIPRDAPVVGMAAHLLPWKNHALFLRACAHVMERCPGTHFVLAGGEPSGGVAGYPARLTELAGRLGIAAHTTFLGHYPDMGGFYRGIDALCHPVVSEPFGRVVAEAMMMGVPVTVMAGSGPAEYVEDGQTGLVAADPTPDCLAEGICRLLTAPSLRHLGENARGFAQAHLSVADTAKRLSRLYQGICRRV